VGGEEAETEHADHQRAETLRSNQQYAAIDPVGDHARVETEKQPWQTLQERGRRNEKRCLRLGCHEQRPGRQSDAVTDAADPRRADQPAVTATQTSRCEAFNQSGHDPSIYGHHRRSYTRPAFVSYVQLVTNSTPPCWRGKRKRFARWFFERVQHTVSVAADRSRSVAHLRLARRRLGGDNEVMATVLVELPGGEGIIRGEDGEIALTHDVTLDGGQPV